MSKKGACKLVALAALGGDENANALLEDADFPFNAAVIEEKRLILNS